MPTTTAFPQRVIPRPALPVECPFPLSLTYQNKQLSLYNRLKSRIRSLKYHYDRIPLKDDSTYHSHAALLARAVYLLDTTNFICNTAYAEALKIFKSFPKSNDSHIIQIFGLKLVRRSRVEYNLLEAQRELNYSKRLGLNVHKYQLKYDSAWAKMHLYKVFKNKLREDNLAMRRSELKKRVRYAIAQAGHDGWFMIFATLTVDDGHYSSVFSDTSTAWTDYIRSVDRAVGINIYGSWRSAVSARNSGYDFHKYFAVIERGSKGRLHFHVIHMMKSLPSGCSDPNLGLTVPNRLNVDGMRRFWPYGQCSTWFPMRYSNSDAFSISNWRWPSPWNSLKNRYIPIPMGGVLRVANYVCKYINKAYGTDERNGDIKWRTKMSRNLGLTPIKMLVNQVDNKQILKTIINPPSNLQLLGQRIPMSIFRRLLFRKWLNRKSSKMSYIRKLLVLSRFSPKENILKNFGDLTEKTLEFSQLSSGVIKTKTLKNMEDFRLNLQMILNNISLELFGLNPLETPPTNSGGFTGSRYHG